MTNQKQGLELSSLPLDFFDPLVDSVSATGTETSVGDEEFMSEMSLFLHVNCLYRITQNFEVKLGLKQKAKLVNDYQFTEFHGKRYLCTRITTIIVQSALRCYVSHEHSIKIHFNTTDWSLEKTIC